MNSIIENQVEKAEREGYKIICDEKRHLVTLPYDRHTMHQAAAFLGIKRQWFHGSHYDIPKRDIPTIYKRVDKCVTQRQILSITKGQITEFSQL